jgi:hypothetical protein
MISSGNYSTVAGVYLMIHRNFPALFKEIRSGMPQIVPDADTIPTYIRNTKKYP